CLAEVSSRFRETGGVYLYVSETFGANTGFAVGWILLISRLSGFAMICNVMVSYLGFFWTPASAGLPRALIITGITATLTVINVVGVSRAAVACDFFTVGKLIPLLLFVAVGLFFIGPQNYSFAAPPAAESFANAVALAFVAFAGFETVLVVTGEIRDPSRNLLFASPVALSGGALIYILIQAFCVATLPQLAGSQKPLADASIRFIGMTGATIVTAGMLISAIGTLSGILLIAPRILFAMAEREQVPQVLAKTHTLFHTPHVAIVVLAIIALVLAVSGTFTYMVTINGITKMLTFASMCATLPALRKRESEKPTGFHLPFGVPLSITAMLICFLLVATIGWREVRDVGITIAVGLLLH